MPERTAISRIDEHRAIVAPATTRAGLMSTRCDKRRFALRHVTWRITGQTTSIADLRIEGRAGGGITNCDVALAIHVDAGHPAKQTIGSVVPILLLCRRRGDCVTSHVELVPANARRTRPRLIVVHAVGRPDRFSTAEILIDERIHQLVAEGV